MLKRTLLSSIFIFISFSVFCDTWYTVTVRGLNADLPFLAWQMTYKIRANSQKEAEQSAKDKAVHDGCAKNSAFIVDITANLEPGKTETESTTAITTPPPPPPPKQAESTTIIINQPASPPPPPPKQEPKQAEPTTIIITQPSVPTPQEKEAVPEISYDESYQAGYDHGITGFLTGRNNSVANEDVPDKYRKSQQVQAYKNGYARGFADEKIKAEKAAEEKKPKPVQPVYPSPRNNNSRPIR
ncbi:hypothetical protein AGMMS49940_05550 [Spirochaetia bacterium]|nr:hypothetical protein AGMMS49940_05550 [Spirochaetia bacterium]